MFICLLVHFCLYLFIYLFPFFFIYVLFTYVLLLFEFLIYGFFLLIHFICFLWLFWFTIYFFHGPWSRWGTIAARCQCHRFKPGLLPWRAAPAQIATEPGGKQGQELLSKWAIFGGGWLLTTSQWHLQLLGCPKKWVNGLFHLSYKWDILGLYWDYNHVGLEYSQLDGAKQGRWKIHEDPYNCNGLEFPILFGWNLEQW